MIQLGRLGYEDNYDRIFKKFNKVNASFTTNGLAIRLNTTSDKLIYGMFYIPSLPRNEIGNFTISKQLQTHPYWDYADIPNGPQITWFTVYSNFRNKGISPLIYEGLIEHFGALYSDHSQTLGGTAIWKSLIKRGNTTIYAVKWRKSDWKITSVTKQNSIDFKDLFGDVGIQTILMAIPKKTKIKEFQISDVEESIEVAFRK